VSTFSAADRRRDLKYRRACEFLFQTRVVSLGKGMVNKRQGKRSEERK
jgi:hypothetical protein